MIIKSIEASTSFNIFSLTSTSCQTRVTALVLHLIHYSTSRSLTTHKCSIYYTDTNTQESSFPIRLHYHHYTSHILFFSSFWNFILTRRAGSTRWMEWCVASCRRIRIPYRSVSTCRCIWSAIYRDSITRCVLNTRLYSERCVRFVCEKSVGRLTNDEPNSDCETERKREREEEVTAKSANTEHGQEHQTFQQWHIRHYNIRRCTHELAVLKTRSSTLTRKKKVQLSGRCTF